MQQRGNQFALILMAVAEAVMAPKRRDVSKTEGQLKEKGNEHQVLCFQPSFSGTQFLRLQ
jgi:hypothetical protein